MPSILLRRPAEELPPTRNAPLRWLYVWLPAMLAVAVIATESTPTFSSERTGSYLRPILEHLFGPISDAAWKAWHHLLRKGGHVVGYGLVCLTFLRGWLYTLLPRLRTLYAQTASWRVQASIRAVSCTALVASLDEIHQSMLPSRTGMFSDVVLDTAAGACACALLYFAAWRRED